jgi:hypothetical protein
MLIKQQEVLHGELRLDREIEGSYSRRMVAAEIDNPAKIIFDPERIQTSLGDLPRH